MFSVSGLLLPSFPLACPVPLSRSLSFRRIGVRRRFVLLAVVGRSAAFLLLACISLEYIEIGMCRCNMHKHVWLLRPCVCVCVCRNIFARIVLLGAEVLIAEANRLRSGRK